MGRRGDYDYGVISPLRRTSLEAQPGSLRIGALRQRPAHPSSSPDAAESRPRADRFAVGSPDFSQKRLSSCNMGGNGNRGVIQLHLRIHSHEGNRLLAQQHVLLKQRDGTFKSIPPLRVTGTVRMTPRPIRSKHRLHLKEAIKQPVIGGELHPLRIARGRAHT